MINAVRKYLNYLLFAGVVLAVVGLAVSHSRHVRALVDTMAAGSPQDRSAAADELIRAEQFMDSISGEPTRVRVDVVAALEQLGTPAAVKQSVAFLKDPDKPVRDRLVIALKRIGARSAAHIKELVVGLKDGDGNVRKGVVAALTDPQDGIGPQPGVVNAVIAIMQKEAGARGPGGTVLGSRRFTGRGANAESLPSLVGLLTGDRKDKDEGVRIGAADALGKIGDPAAVPTLIEASKKDTAQVRRVALGALALIADRSAEAALTEALQNPEDDNEARTQAAAGVGKIGTATAIATLIQALSDADLKLRSAAVAALTRAGRRRPDGPADSLTLRHLIAALRSDQDMIRLGAARALQGIAAPEATPALLATLRSDQVSLRAAGASALGFPGNRAAVPALIASLGDPDGDVVIAARDALAAIGPEATETLIANLSRGGPTAYYAAQALARQGASALPALVRAAQSENPLAQRWAAVALGDMGLAEARPTLHRLENSRDADVAYVAKAQLDRLGRAQ